MSGRPAAPGGADGPASAPRSATLPAAPAVPDASAALRAPAASTAPGTTPTTVAAAVRHETRSFLRYATVGAIATAVHYLLLTLAVEALGWPAWLASGFGAALGAQVAYVGNRVYTFDHGGAIGTSWLRFQATALYGALQGMAIVALGVHAGWHYLPAQMVATVMGLVATYAVNRIWTFR